MFDAKKGDGDYHSEMDAHNFEKWFSKFLPNIEKDAVIVMDNAPYHSRKLEKVPTTATRKKDIQNWLESKNISFEPTEVRAELLKKVREHKHLYQAYVVDELAKVHGVSVVRLPPYHCELNPIELVWAQIKGYVASKNKTFKLNEVKELLPQAMATITPERWKACVEHVIKEEENFFQLDGIIDNLVEIIIRVGDSSSSSNDSDDDDDE